MSRQSTAAGKLYVVPTPIGNLEDITLRALRILREVDFILAEDTRTTGILLKHYEISTKLISHHKFNEHFTVSNVTRRIEAGENAALVSDAGTPGISDPGYLLVKYCIDADIEVECLPGASALIPAVVAAGLPNDRFCFEGFIPQKKAVRRNLCHLQRKAVPWFSTNLLTVLSKPFSSAPNTSEDRRAAVCRELSKVHEEIRRGTVAELLAWYLENDPRGEIVLVVEGKRNRRIDSHPHKSI